MSRTTNYDTFASCTKITPRCPLEATVVSYRPNLGANAFFLAMFALCGILQLVFGIKHRTFTFMLALLIGCVLECIGYAGRIMLNINPWSTAGFEIEIICLIIAPVFLAAGIYLTLKHFVIVFGQKHSILKPKLYTWIFISADIFSLVLQGTGGSLAASGQSAGTSQTGTDMALAGIIFQVVSLLVFGILFALYFSQVYRHRLDLSAEARQIAHSARFRAFFAGTWLALLTVFTRCVYRCFELGGHFRNSVFRSETDFIALDGVMIAVAVLVLTMAHPGFCFGGLSRSTKDIAQEIEAKAVDSDLCSEQGDAFQVVSR